MQKPTATAASSETRLIPLNKLRHDDRNVRGNADDPATAQADAELVASIRAHGLLENLVVTPRTKTLFGVAAGARRLAALNALAAAGWPRVVAHPRLPQIRTCPTRASGSSNRGIATRSARTHEPPFPTAPRYLPHFR